MTSPTSAFNWIGLAVADLGRSRRFYEELLGFTYERELSAPDEATAQLLRIEQPVNLTAVYLRLDGFVLELLHFDRPGNPGARIRPMNEPGLTHISVGVPDIPAVLALVPDYGGAVLSDTDLGVAVCIRDPDGQLIELLPIPGGPPAGQSDGTSPEDGAGELG